MTTPGDYSQGVGLQALKRVAVDFHISPVEDIDLAAVIEVYRQCEDFLSLGPVPHATPEMVLADIQLSREAGGTFCAILDPQSKKMIGVIDYIMSGYLGNPQQAFIELLMIIPAFRKQGLGAAIVVWLEQKILNLPEVVVIKAGVQVNNPSAIVFWQNQGYKITGGPVLQPDRTIAYSIEKKIR